VDAERWQRVEVLFDQAMACPDDERSGYNRLAEAWLRGRMRDSG
jgi:hypothetical protein